MDHKGRYDASVTSPAMKRTRPQNDQQWKVEPMPAGRTLGDLRAPELAELLAAAYGRIRTLELEMTVSMANYQLGSIWWPEDADTIAGMRDFLILFIHVIVTLARLARPGGLRSVVAESALVRHQLLVLNRGRKRAPNLRAADRVIAGLCTLFMRPARVLRSAILLKPSTLLHLHSLLRKRKYRLSFSSERRRRPGPKGPNESLIRAVVAMKRRNPRWGCPCIAQQIALAFVSRSTKMSFAVF
jgi:hypothetical protein